MEDRKLSLNPSGQTFDNDFVIFAFERSVCTFVLCLFRYRRDFVVEGEPYAGYDRHNAEVAAFHLDRYIHVMDTVVCVSVRSVSRKTICCCCCCFVCVFNAIRILGFRRAPLVVGRYINLRTEIKPVATDQLLSTFLMQGECAHSHRTVLTSYKYIT